MDGNRTPNDFVLCLMWLEKELAKEVGEEYWSEIEDIFHSKLSKLHEESEQDKARQLTVELLQLFSPHPTVKEIISSGLQIISQTRNNIRESLSNHETGLIITDQMLNDIVIVMAEYLPIPVSKERRISMAPHGEGGATSVKLANLDSNLEQIANIIAGFVVNTVGIIGQEPGVIAAGLWLNYTLWRTSVTKNIDERDSSVLWGIIKASQRTGGATEADVVRFTNIERNKKDWVPLAEGEIRSALNRLEKEYRSIELIDGEWRIVESLQISS